MHWSCTHCTMINPYPASGPLICTVCARTSGSPTGAQKAAPSPSRHPPKAVQQQVTPPPVTSVPRTQQANGVSPQVMLGPKGDVELSGTLMLNGKVQVIDGTTSPDVVELLCELLARVKRKEGGGEPSVPSAPSAPSASGGPPPEAPKVSSTGGLVDGRDTGVVLSNANAGGLGGERTPGKAKEQRADPNGIINLTERKPVGMYGGGSRANPSSKERVYDVNGFEQAVDMDEREQRLQNGVRLPVRSREDKQADQVMFETCGVSEKMHNVVWVGGERVAEMDHAVAVSVASKDGKQFQVPPALAAKGPELINEALGRAGKKVLPYETVGGRPGETPTDITNIVLRDMLEKVVEVREHRVQTPFKFSTLPDYHGALDSLRPFLRIFSKLLEAAARVLAYPSDRIHIVYIPTIRANLSVAARSDDHVDVNLMVFQQQYLALEVGPDGAPLRIKNSDYGRLLCYWVMRIVNAYEGIPPALPIFPKEGMSDDSSSPYSRPRGLYDRAVRQRYTVEVKKYQGG